MDTLGHHQKYLQRVALSKDANITILSVGGCGCTYVLDLLQAHYPELKVNKRHLLSEELLFKPKQTFIYIHNDPLLALLSRYRRGILYKGWAQWDHVGSLHLKTIDLPKTSLEEIYEDFSVYKAFLEKPPKNKKKNSIGILSPDFEKEFAQNLFKTTIKHEKDCYGIESHFDYVFSLKNKINVHFLDVRDPTISKKLTNIVNKPIDFEFKERESSKKDLKHIKCNSKKIVEIYSSLDKKITNLIQ